MIDERGKPFVTMTHDEASKNHPCGLHDEPSYERRARMYETNSATDGYKALKLYFSKVNAKCEALFQQPRRDWNDHSSTDLLV